MDRENDRVFLPRLKAVHTDHFTFVPQDVTRIPKNGSKRQRPKSQEATRPSFHSDVDSGIGSSLETESLTHGLEVLSIRSDWRHSDASSDTQTDSDSMSLIGEQRVALDENWTLLRHQWDSIKV